MKIALAIRDVLGVDAITAVPEPSTFVLMAIGAGLAALAARRRA